MTNSAFKDLFNYLNKKKVPFALKQQGSKVSFLGKFKITKEGKFYKCNGKIICKNMAFELYNYDLVTY